MNVLQEVVETVTSPTVVQNVGWLLIHSLWQSILIAVTALCVAKVLWRQSSSARYGMYSLALSLMVQSPVVTVLVFPQMEVPSSIREPHDRRTPADWMVDLQSIEGDGSTSLPIVASNEEERIPSKISVIGPARVAKGERNATSYLDWIKAKLSPWLSTIVVIWCCGVMLFSVRPIWGWLMVRRLIRIGTSPVVVHVQEALQRVREKMQVRRRVEVLASSLVDSPIVVGCFRSVILVPANMVSHLPVTQIDAILAHELAHVRRYDYLVNLMQTLVETLLFYHPAAWWLSHRIRVERENCCDDLVVAVLEDKAEYGRALLAVEEFRGSAVRSALALSARDGSLLRRIRRLLTGPSSSVQRANSGIASAAAAIIGIFTTFVCWSVMTSAQNKDDFASFGAASHGLKARIVALRPDVNDDAPNLGLRQSEYESSEQMAFGVELTNIGDAPLTLAGIRYGKGFAKEVQGTLRTELLGPHWFEFEFLDEEGKLLSRTHREFHQPWQVASDASTHELTPGQSLIEVLRPGRFRPPMDFDLPPGAYRVRVRYHGPDKEFLDNVSKIWPNQPVLNAWPHEVVSNTVDFQIASVRKSSNSKETADHADDNSDPKTADGSRRTATHRVWGKPVDGLQAALEYRTAEDVSGDPAVAPGVLVGTPIGIIFHVKNVSDKRITFISETGRQGDKVHVTNERGEKVDVKDVWYSGWPIDVAWKLEPGETAQLNLLTPSLHSLNQPGKYNVRYTLRFNSRIQKDDAGNVIFPRPGDYDKEVETGVTPLFLTVAQKNAATVKQKIHVATRAGRFQITEDAELEIAQKLVHASDVMTSGVIRLQDDRTFPRHVALSIAVDYFANRERWKGVWEEGQRVLWYAKGLGDGPGRRLPPGTKVKIEELRRIDFNHSECIVHQSFDGWVADRLPSAEIRAALEEEFEINANGKESNRSYEMARQGLQLDETSKQLFVWVGENGNCQVQDLAWESNSGDPREIKCDVKTLAETLAFVLKKFRTKTRQDVPIYAHVSTRPDLELDTLRTVREACLEQGLMTPDLPLAKQATKGTGESASVSPNGEIRGILIDGEEKPVAGAVVACGAIYRQDGQDGGTRTTTDAEGRYRLVVPSPGIYSVFLKSYEVDPKQTAAVDDGVRVEAGQVTQSKLRMVEGQQVAGKAVDENGIPLAGLTVMCSSAARPHSLGSVQSTTTKEDGAFEFYLAPGPGRIYATETVRETAENPLRMGRTGSIDLTVSKNGVKAPVTLIMGRRESQFGSDEWLTRSSPGTKILSRGQKEDVTGTVVDKAGTPLANAMIIKTDDKPVTTDADGRFRVSCRKGTQFVMHAFLSGYQVWFGTPTAGDELRIVMVKKQISEVASAEDEDVFGNHTKAKSNTKNNPSWLRFCPGTQIVEHTDAQFVSGVVVDEEGRPISNCRVEHPGLVGPETDDQGKFQYQQSMPHRTVLRAYHPDYRVWHGAPELGDVVRIVLKKKQKVETLNGTREMTVRVIDSQTAESVPNVKVTASRYEGPQNGTVAATGVTNHDGTVVMRGLDFIQHQLVLSADLPVSYIGDRAHSGASQDEVVMLVDRACELVLRAVDSETSKGIAGVRFDRERALAELWAAPVVDDILGSKDTEGTLTDENGYARFLVGPATWSYLILKYPKGYDSIVAIDGKQEVEIGTPVGGKVEHTFRLVREKEVTSGNQNGVKRWKFRVFEGATDRPVSKVQVRLMPWRKGKGLLEPVLLEGIEDGWLEFDAPEPGGGLIHVVDERFFHASLEGVKPPSDTLWDDGVWFPQWMFESADGKSPPAIRCWRGSRFIGRVQQADGTPAAKAKLNIGARVIDTTWMDLLGIDHKVWMSWDHGQWPNWTTTITTDDRGQFEVRVPPGDAISYVRVGSASLGFSAINDTVTRNNAPNSPLLAHVPFMVELKRETERERTLDAGEIKLESGVRLSGKVVDSNGTPVEGVQVWAEPIVTIRRDAYEFSPHAGRFLITDNQGGFEFAPLRPGAVKVTVRDRPRGKDGSPVEPNFSITLLTTEVTLPEDRKNVVKELMIEK